MKGKTVKGNWSLRTNKLTFPYVFLICIFFFLAGFFGSTLFSHSQDGGHGLRPRPKILESTVKEMEYNLMTVGDSGDDSITSIPFQVLSWKPRALYFPNFATAEQCEGIVDVAKVGLKPSSLALRKGENEENTKGDRTSSGMFVSASEDKTGILDVIEEKIARTTMIPRTHGEAFNVLRYEIGQRYNSHYDAFNPAEYGPQKSQRSLHDQLRIQCDVKYIFGGQKWTNLWEDICCPAKMASFLLYLTDVEEGGETMFPFENGLNMDGSYGYEDCIGLRVRPRQGDGLLFYSLFPNGTIDPTSLHGSCPVIKGEKWVATKWITNEEQND